MASQRVQRVQNLLRAEISTIIQRRVKDPRVAMATVTQVDVAPDLKQARVLVSIYGDQRARREALAGLESAAGFIRMELMKALHLRPMPHLEFRLDESLAHGARTLDLLEQVRHEREDAEASAEPSDPADPRQ